VEKGKQKMLLTHSYAQEGTSRIIVDII